MQPKQERSIISPSGFERIILCPASLRMELDIEQMDTTYSEEGVYLHEKIHQMLTNKKEFLKEEILEEHLEVLEKAKNIFSKIADFKNTFFEKKVRVTSVDSYITGTVDCYDVSDNVVRVIDWKFGKWVKVSSKENVQLTLYLLGVLDSLSEKNLDNMKAELIIIQPNVSDQACVYKIENLKEYVTEKVSIYKKAITEALKEDAKFAPSVKSCRFCRAKSVCPALHETFKKIVDLKNEPVGKERIINVLENYDIVEMFIKSIKQTAMDLLLMGEELGDFILTEGRSKREFTEDGIKELIEKLGEKAYEKNIIGLTKAEKLLGKKIVDSLTKKTYNNNTIIKKSNSDFEKLI